MPRHSQIDGAGTKRNGCQVIMTANRLISLEFFLKWESPWAAHMDRYVADRVDLRGDIFPQDMARQVAALEKGEACEKSFAPGILVDAFEKNQIISFHESRFEAKAGDDRIIPRLGRFYPQGFAWTALNCYPGTQKPFRVIKMDNAELVADISHPLARYPLTLKAVRIEDLEPNKGYSGEVRDIAEMVTQNGPGMQVPYSGISTDFYSVYPFTRSNEDNDRIFYQSPRLVNHLDDTAIQQITAIYARLLSSGSKILDLMSSWVSHLPETLTDCAVTGLGLNETELSANPQLSSTVIYDLNQNPALPFEDHCFDAVVCTASIEYLTKPLEVIAEVARVTRPGGVFVSTFSDRWFPGKQISPWQELHRFERLGLVLDYYLKTGAFEDLHTESVRGYPRPKNDKHISERKVSDPVFAVWGRVRKDFVPAARP